LILAPTLYSLLDDVAIWCKRVVRAANQENVSVTSVVNN